jgi:prepilin-type N-terminal cleavage/methylation domain-containing protein
MMTHRGRTGARAFTLVEMVVAMAVMGIIMTLAALEFKYIVFSHLSAESHLTAEQQARVAMAKITGAAHQASVVDSSPNPLATATPAIIEPVTTPGPRLVYTQAASLDPSAMPIQNGVPVPCYNQVQLYLDKAPGDTVGTLKELATPIGPSLGSCAGFDYSHMPLLLARNVQDFQVSPIANNVDPYAAGYRIDLTIYDEEGHQIDQRAGALYTLSTVISPIVYGAAK